MRLIHKIKYVLRTKPQRVVLICLQRSGSNMFTSILNQHKRINFIGQIFKDNQAFQQSLIKKGAIPFKGKLFGDDLAYRKAFYQLEKEKHLRETRNATNFVESVFNAFEKEHPQYLHMIKFHGGTLYADEIRNIFLNEKYKIIVFVKIIIFK